MSELHPEVQKMIRLLHTRVQKRRHTGGHHYRLDMRLKGLRGGRLGIRDPEHTEWPDKGRVARTKAEALEWVDEYAKRLGVDWCRGGTRLDTVQEHGDAYLEALRARKGADSSTYRNYKSYLNNHLYPAVGDRRLRTLGTAHVQALIDNMTTAKGTEAGKELRRGVLGALNNVWRRSCPKDPVPWAKQITIPGEDANRARRERAASGERLFDQGGGYTFEELRWILIVALALDLVGERKSMKRRGVNNHADLVAFLMHHTVRVEEPTFLRRKDFKLDLDAVLVAGTKTPAAEERLIPTQRVYEPWRDRLLAEGDDPEDFLLLSSDRHTQPTDSNYKDKIKRVLIAAGLKREGDLTHIFRASHTSIAVGTLTAEQIAAISGHQIPGDEQLSDHYLVWRSFIAGLPEKAFTYFPNLGTPEELEEEARKALREGRVDLEAVEADKRQRRGAS